MVVVEVVVVKDCTGFPVNTILALFLVVWEEDTMASVKSGLAGGGRWDKQRQI